MFLPWCNFILNNLTYVYKPIFYVMSNAIYDAHQQIHTKNVIWKKLDKYIPHALEHYEKHGVKLCQIKKILQKETAY